MAGGRETATCVPEAPTPGSFEPYTQWPAGVRRYGSERTTDLALVPLFDFVNHEAVSARWA